MKLKTCLLAAFAVLLTSVNGFAQYPNVNNAGMENWDNIGATNVEPTNWNSFMTADATFLTQFGKKKRVDRSTVRRPGTTGSYSAVIWSTDETVAIANGNITTGKINMGSTTANSPDNYNFTKTTDANFCHPLASHPDSLVVWVRFRPFSGGSETARVRAVIHDNYNLRDPLDANSTSHVVGDATLNFPKTKPSTDQNVINNNYFVRLAIPFNYTGPSVNPMYLLVSFTTNNVPGGGSAKDSLYFDDIQLIYNPVLSTGTISPNLYSVSATEGAPVSVPFTLTGPMNPANIVTAQLSDASGSFANPLFLGSLTTTASGTITGTIPAGTATGSGYRIRVVTSNPALIAAANTSNIQITQVGNGISPSSPQFILPNTAGSILSVTETPSATSREWKYAVVSGGPYSSFSTVQTNTNYTPIFQNTGTYYVICQSLISGLTVVSNQVTITVTTFKTLNAKVFFEGLYNGSGTMNQAQGTSGPQFPAGIADKVSVELHSSTAPYGIFYEQNNVDLHTDGTLQITNIPGTISGPFYIVIKHRNSIETWSALPFDFTGAGPFSYDFSTAASQAYGNNQKLMGTVYAIWGGDPNQDGIVDGSDMSVIDNGSQPPILHGYYPEDVNGDGIVDGSDMSMVDNNSAPPPVLVMRP